MPSKPASTVIPVAITAGAADELVHDGRCNLMGWSFREDAAGTADVVIRDGSATGRVIAYAPAFASGDVQTVYFGDGGIRVNTGIFVERETGSIEGVVYIL